MGSDINHTHTVEIDYDAFCGALAARGLQPLGIARGHGNNLDIGQPPGWPDERGDSDRGCAEYANAEWRNAT